MTASIIDQKKNPRSTKNLTPIIKQTSDDVYKYASNGKRRLKQGYINKDGQIYKSIMFAGTLRYVRVLFADEK